VATMAARGDYFEIWNADTYKAEEDADLNEFLAEQDDDFDPLSLLDGAKGA